MSGRDLAGADQHLVGRKMPFYSLCHLLWGRTPRSLRRTPRNAVVRVPKSAALAVAGEMGMAEDVEAVAAKVLEVALVEAEPGQAGEPHRCHEFACRTQSIGKEARCNPRSEKYSAGCSTPVPL